MSEIVQGAFIGAGGTLLGIIITLIVQYLMEKGKCAMRRNVRF